MYIIACIKDGIVYSSDSKLFMALEPAIVRLSLLEAHGKKGMKIYEITDLKEINTK